MLVYTSRRLDLINYTLWVKAQKPVMIVSNTNRTTITKVKRRTSDGVVEWHVDLKMPSA